MFVHLRLHTEFSVVDGTTRIDDAVKAAAADGQPAMAITDLNNMFGAVKLYRTARAKGVKPVLGAEITVDGLGAAPSNLILLVQNHAGYLHLSELLTRAWTDDIQKNQPLVRWDVLRDCADGLIVLSGAQAGPVGQALMRGDAGQADAMAQQLARAFPQRFYIELQRAARPDDEAHVRAAVQLAARLQLPVVATHPVQFGTAEEYEAHEARVCIAEGDILGNPRRVRRFTPEQYFKTQAQMEALFADVPSALANTVEIARRCSITLELGHPQLPKFPIPEGFTREEYFRHASQEGLEERLKLLYPDAAEREKQRPHYQERLEFELGTILKMGFPGYFLIVADFINWAKQNGCPVGPGRGSGASSLVAYALKITDLDPLRYNLLFERFLNPERVSMPDFDVDFCQANRDRVIDYVKSRYGKDAVSQIATFGTMAARAAIRDVGRVLDMSYTFCDGVSKLIPNKPGKPVSLQYPPADLAEGDKEKYAIAAEPQLAERIKNEEEVRTLVEMAQKLEGVTRNIGMHAGGVVIAPGKLTDFGPLYQQPGSTSAVTQYDKGDVEDVGLVKFDFLGLATLTILQLAKEFIVRRHPDQAGFDYEKIPLDDTATFKLFQEGRTEAVFQFESRGMQGMLRDALPTRFEDLVALNAMYRPGPMENIPSFVARKRGRERVSYPHPLLEPVLSETYGIMVYQEQVMQAAQILAGYSLGGADLLRRAMGKKKLSEMVKQRATFREGAGKNGIKPEKADEIFDLMEKFAGYGFNKSHAVAYSLLAYHTAWLKVHYPAEFFCANMTIEMDNTDKLKVLCDDALREGLHFDLPDVNHGDYRFEPLADDRIGYGLGAVKGTGQLAIEAIVAAREGHGSGSAGTEQGAFKSLFDFCRRVDRMRVNKRTVEALIRAGAFDPLEPNRAAQVASLDVAFDYAATCDADQNQGGLFDSVGDGYGSSTHEPALEAAPAWDVKERLTQEKGALGFFLSGHLFDQVAAEVRQFVPRTLAELTSAAGRETHRVAGIVSDFRVINGHRGRIALFRLDDKSAVLEVRAEEDVAARFRHLLKNDELIIAEARVFPDRFSGGVQLNVMRVWDLPAARCHFGKYLAVDGGARDLQVARLLGEFPPKIEQQGDERVVHGLPVRLLLERGPQATRTRLQLQLDERARVYPSDAALAGWKAQAGDGAASVVYR
ncbi:MAG: DNA polymerase III subunit alpha [Burkholderiaceae bacterium]|nr:MAG: DNA polymerase III subunit alpha [Burkholderiaceae bacterium]